MELLEDATKHAIKRGHLASIRVYRSAPGHLYVHKKVSCQEFLLNHVYVLALLKETGIVPQMRSFSLRDLSLEYTYMSGSYIDEVDKADREMCFFASGVSLATIHTHAFDGYGFVFTSRDTKSDWWSIQDKRFIELLLYCQTHRLLARSIIEQVKKIYYYYREDVAPERESCLCHCDYRFDNLIFVNEHGRWSCKVLDFDHVVAGPSHFDLGRIEQDIFSVCPSAMAPFIRGYESVRPFPSLQHTLYLYRLIWPLSLIVWGARNNADDLVSQNQDKLSRYSSGEISFPVKCYSD